MAVAAPPVPKHRRSGFRSWLPLGAGVIAAAIAVIAVLLATHWPFTKGHVLGDLQRVSESDVSISRFEETFFPHPGCVLQNVVFTRGSLTQIGSIRQLTVEGSWTALFTFTHFIRSMRAEGFRVYIPSPMPPPVEKGPKKKPETTVGELIADGATLQVHGLVFAFPKITFHNVGKAKKIHIDLSMRNPEPPDDVHAQFDFGPWRTGQAALTPISGSFEFQNADLGHYHGIAGMLSATGKFTGTLGKLQVEGKAAVPNFELTSKRQPVALQAQYNVAVNALHGDIQLDQVEVSALRTTLSVHGSIAGRAHERGKFVDLVFNSRSARIQDVMHPFISAKEPPLDGPITFRAHVVLPPGKQPFEHKVQLDGDFGITDAEFTNKNTQANVNRLSERARGEKDEAIQNVVSDLKGQVRLRNAVATFSNLTFITPGAKARLAGTFNLINEQIDLKGAVATEASLSDDTGHGIKSFLLKPLDPLFRKKHAGAVIAVQMTGTYSHPVYRYSLWKKIASR